MLLKSLGFSTWKVEDSFAGVLPTGSTTQWPRNLFERFIQVTGAEDFLIPIFSQETTDTSEHGRGFRPINVTPGKPDITESAREVLRSIPNREMAEEAEYILDELQTQLQRIGSVENLPAIRVFEAEDGSLLIEWIFTHFRIGFSLEPEKQDSGWFLVSDDSAGGISASGFLEGINIEWLMSWLIGFVINRFLVIE